MSNIDSEGLERALIRQALLVDAELARLLEDMALPGELVRPGRLMQAMRYSALGAGKRLRPFLLIETARLFGVEHAGVQRAAAALEMVHCYSLIHDDLPAMDDDDLRRGKPTLHRAFDEATAILAGDALLTYAFDVLADEATSPNAALRARLVLGLARAAGQGGMVGGQMLDLAAEKAATPLSLEEIERLQAMKTGALLAFAVEAGGLFAGCSPRDAELLKTYGKNLGAAFQIADDLLDYSGDAAVLGKAVGKDADRNKATLVSLLGVERSVHVCAELAQAAKIALEQVDCSDDKSILLQTVDFVISRQS